LRGSNRWKNNWRIVRPPEGVRVDLGRGRVRRQASRHTLRALPPGTPVVLVASAPGAARRCRAFASETGIDLRREYLAFPSAETPAYLVESAPAAASLFVKHVLAAPPRSPLFIRAGVTLLRRFGTWPVIRALAPGRVAVGRTT